MSSSTIDVESEPLLEIPPEKQTIVAETKTLLGLAWPISLGYLLQMSLGLASYVSFS
jgi:hypothetical protein